MRILLLASAALLLSGCGTTGTAKSAWNAVIKNCGQSDLNSKNILFFGPSNAVGPGSIWRIDDAGVYQLRYDLKQMPEPQSFTAEYNPANCVGTSKKSFKGGFDVSVSTTPVSGEAKTDFSRAQTVTANAKKWAWVTVSEGPYEEYAKALPAGDSVKADLDKGTRQVLYRGLMIKGFDTTMTFKSDVAASLKAKYPSGPLPAGLVGDLGGGLTANWSNENTLTIGTDGEFFIAGEFKPYNPDGFAGAGKSALGPLLVVDGKAMVAREQP